MKNKTKMTRIAEMTDKERFLRTFRYEKVDRRPLYLADPWSDTLDRWHSEGLPRDVKDVHEYLGVKHLRLLNVTGTSGIYPKFERKVLKEDAETITEIDNNGCTVLRFKHHTSLPEWLDFPVKNKSDLLRVMDEHFDVTNLDARFDAAWKERIGQAMASDCVVILDGGCFYGSLRNLAGVENISYLFYDAPDEVDEFFERYLTVVMEGFRRVTKLIKVDVIGFGEDIAYKNGPLMSIDMFRRMILPRYKKAMDAAHEEGVEFTWYDSDGDLRLLIPDFLSVGINGLAPCEVAANMDPVSLRRQFGRDLRVVGGFDKRIVAQGKTAIDAEFARLKPMIDEGGFLPAIDHSVSADISFDNYRYFIDAVQKALKI